MTAATYLKTQGTQLYKVDSATTSVEISNLTTFAKPNPSADELETTVLVSTAKEFVQGLKDYGEVSFDYNWVPTESSHQKLQTDFDNGTVREWLIGFSDGSDAAPTVSSSAFGTPATTRSWVKFSGFIKGLNASGGINAIAAGQLTIRASGTPTIYVKS